MTTATMIENWSIEVQFEEDPHHTTATAHVQLPGGSVLRGVGRARRHPADRPVAAIGEEVACARALTQLTHVLLDRAAEDIELNMNRGDPAQ